jgi:hypothetical protein
MSLAAKLPYDHPYAGGYPGIGSQPLPTDADALDYLARVKAADGAGVEVGVATAVSAFVADSKALGVWDSIRASCILAGARTLAGALVPLKNEGPELVDINSLPTPSLTEAGGSSGAWEASTRKMLSNAVGTNTSHPRFLFPFAGMAAGKQYAISGRVSGDTSHVEFIRAGATGDLAAINKVTGEFSASLASSGTNGFMFLLNGTLAPTSVTIESLSIREVIAAPTNVADGFVEGDFSRTAGLTGDGTSYLDTGRPQNSDPQNDAHISVFITASKTAADVRHAGTTDTSALSYLLLYEDNSFTGAYVSSNSITDVSNRTGVNLFGGTRDSSSQQTARVDGVSNTTAVASRAPSTLNSYVFCRNLNGSPSAFSDATIAFYSIGTSLSLEDLDTAVSNLINRLKFAILVGENPSGLDPDTIDYVVRGYEAGGSLE